MGQVLRTKKGMYLACLFLLPDLFLRVIRRFRLERLVNLYAKWRRGELRRLENIIRCESHRDAVLHILESEHSE